MPVNFKLRAIERERVREREREMRARESAPAMMHFQQRTETRTRRGFIIDFPSYKVLIIVLMSLMFMSDLCYNFHLHYQVIPKIACVFSKPFDVRKLF